MKKLLLACSIFVISSRVNAQITRSMEVQKQNIKVISPSGQARMRTDLSTLKIQSAQLCDSVATLQQKINESVKELESLGASNELITLRVQQHTDRISKMMTTLSNILKKMSETSSSIIGNMK